ncbi:unnamed protein product [marine sediment metagenome]|uniref:Uncharacterized protein n=1 Tax=marine sediment metagenome TaxID=412755 RepID=X1LA47_9ZZZZ
MKLKWLWHWKGKNGIEHMTTNQEEADKALHSGARITVWAERISGSGIKIIRKNRSR